MFDVLDKNKAYLLGLILTDGNLYKKTPCVSIELQTKDKQILDDILKVFGGSVLPQKHKGKIKSYRWNFPISKYGDKGFGWKLYEQLEKFYIVPNKTFLVKFPNIPEEFLLHFIRGLWDGDGSFFFHRGYIESSFCSASYDFILGFKNILEKLDIKSRIRKQYNSYNLDLSIKNTKRLINLIYSDLGLFLNRKYTVAIDGINKKKNKSFWTSEEIEYLNNNYMNYTLKELSKIMGRTVMAIKIKANRVGIKKYKNKCLPGSEVDNDEEISEEETD